MDLLISKLLISSLSNAIRMSAIKHFIDIFLANDEGKWKYQKFTYIFFWLETLIIHMIWHLPILNIISNILGLTLLVLPYKVRVSRKALIVILIYGINVFVDSVIILSTTHYTYGHPVNQLNGCLTSLTLFLISIVFQKTMHTKRDVMLPFTYRIALSVVPLISIAMIVYMLVESLTTKTTVIVVVLGLLFINIVIFYLYDSLVQFYSARFEKTMLEQMIDIYAYQLNVVQESQEKVKSLRHDLKHHIIELRGLAEQQDTSAILEYLESMKKFMLNPQEYVSTGNQDIDGVLNYLLQQAEEVLNHIELKVNIPNKQYLKNFNVCVILGNIVDNAIREAAKSEEKYLELDIHIKHGVLIIFAKNSYAGNIIKRDEQIISTQNNLAIHGIGLENVKKVVELNGGEIDIEYTDNWFKVCVLLYLSDMK